MENYIVSARKYRPATFDTVVGQRSLTTTLKNAIATSKLAHAYLFCGPRGVGKTTCARIFAKTINCMHPTTEGEACNTCESCVSFNEQRSYNIYELDAASNNSVDDIRQLVEQVRIPPQVGKYKVYIIDEVHMLSASAFNAFLKTLEEPPRHAIFILATTEKHKILPTILSRCQIYDFNRINIEDTVAHLAYVASKEGITAEPEALNVIALKADGGMRDALSIFDQTASFTNGHITYQKVIENLHVLDYEYYFRLTDYFLENKVCESLLLFNEILNKGFDASHFITGLSSHLRDVMVSKDNVTLPLLEVGSTIRQRYQTQAQKAPLNFLYKAMKLCNDCDLNYRASKNKRLLVELTLIQVAQLTETEKDINDGRSPKRHITPIFSPSVAPNTPQNAVPTSQSPIAQNATGKKIGNNTHSAEQIHPAHSIIEHTESEKIKKSPILKNETLGISIKQHSVPIPTPKPSTQNTNAVIEDNRMFNERDVNYYWLEYANAMPHEQIAMSKRMQSMRLVMTDKNSFEAVFENEIIAKEFAVLQPEIQNYLRSHLKNREATLQIRVSTPEEKERAYSRTEKFKLMSQKNNAVLELQQAFGLEFY